MCALLAPAVQWYRVHCWRPISRAMNPPSTPTTVTATVAVTRKSQSSTYRLGVVKGKERSKDGGFGLPVPAVHAALLTPLISTYVAGEVSSWLNFCAIMLIVQASIWHALIICPCWNSGPSVAHAHCLSAVRASKGNELLFAKQNVLGCFNYKQAWTRPWVAQRDLLCTLGRVCALARLAACPIRAQSTLVPSPMKLAENSCFFSCDFSEIFSQAARLPGRI